MKWNVRAWTVVKWLQIGSTGGFLWPLMMFWEPYNAGNLWSTDGLWVSWEVLCPVDLGMSPLYCLQDLTCVKIDLQVRYKCPVWKWKLPIGIAVSDWHATLKSTWPTIINTINISFRFLLYLGAKGWVMLSICPKSNTCTARSSCLIGCAWHWVVGFLKSCSSEG